MKTKAFLFWSFSIIFGNWAMAAAPTITGFSPGSGTLGTTITIKGTDLKNTKSVNIGGVPATDIFVVSNTSIRAKVGSGSNTDFITLETPEGLASTKKSQLGHLENGKFESLCSPFVNINRSLAIRDSSIINHANAKGAEGVWSFNFLMKQMAPSNMTPSAFIKKWLINWRDTTKVNNQKLASTRFTPNTTRIGRLLANWPRVTGEASEFDGTAPLDLNSDQFNLVAITFRPDLDNTSSTPSSGEGRFVYKIAGSSDDEIIFEYKLPKNSGTLPTTGSGWALRIHDLSTLNFGTAYIAKLKSVTDRFTKKTFSGVAGMQNGSGINQVRTNTIEMEGGQWALREFRLTPKAIPGGDGVVAADIGELASTTTHNNPAELFNTQGSVVETWVKENESSLLSGTAIFDSGTLGGLAASQTTNGWTFKQGSVKASVKKAFDMNTCKGCHNPSVNLNSNAGTSNPFLQASDSGFSSFMTGTKNGSVANPLVGVSTPMPNGFLTPFQFNSDGTVTAHPGYSDLHSRAHNILTKLVVNFCR